MSYISNTAAYNMMGWIGDRIIDLTLHPFCDADFAGCPYTLRSTSGHHVDIQGPSSRFPWAASSTRQTSSAHSTPEAEMSAASSGLFNKGEPAIEIWSRLLGPYHDGRDSSEWLRANLHDDITSCISVARGFMHLEGDCFFFLFIGTSVLRG